jgi:hypothetical protein
VMFEAWPIIWAANPSLGCIPAAPLVGTVWARRFGWLGDRMRCRIMLILLQVANLVNSRAHFHLHSFSPASCRFKQKSNKRI